MEFTEEGLKVVKTLKFAQMVDEYLSPWREQGVSDLHLTKVLAAVVSWAATGQAILRADGFCSQSRHGDRRS